MRTLIKRQHATLQFCGSLSVGHVFAPMSPTANQLTDQVLCFFPRGQSFERSSLNKYISGDYSWLCWRWPSPHPTSPDLIKDCHYRGQTAIRHFISSVLLWPHCTWDQWCFTTGVKLLMWACTFVLLHWCILPGYPEPLYNVHSVLWGCSAVTSQFNHAFRLLISPFTRFPLLTVWAGTDSPYNPLRCDMTASVLLHFSSRVV